MLLLTFRRASLFAACLLAVPSLARAWSDGGACNVPRSLPEPGPIPANTPGFVTYGNEFEYPLTIRLAEVAADGAETPVDFTISTTTTRLPDFSVPLVPTTPLTVGAHYRIYPGACRLDATHHPDAPFDYTVVDAVPFPTTIGTLAFTPLEHDWYRDYHFESILTLSAEMAQWAWAYSISIIANGHLSGEFVLVACPPIASGDWLASPGVVSFEVTATPLFGGTSPPGFGASTVIDCGSVVEVDAGLPMPAPDAGVVDDGVAPIDAGSPTPPPFDAGIVDAAVAPSGMMRCEVSGYGGPPPWVGATLLFAVAAVLRRRRAS